MYVYARTQRQIALFIAAVVDAAHVCLFVVVVVAISVIAIYMLVVDFSLCEFCLTFAVSRHGRPSNRRQTTI